MTKEIITHHPEPGVSTGHENTKVERQNCKHCTPHNFDSIQELAASVTCDPADECPTCGSFLDGDL